MKDKCLNCGGENILKGVRAVDRGEGNGTYTMQIQTYRKPNAFLFRCTITADVQAAVCEDCGFVMLFARPYEVAKLKEGTGK